MKLKQLSGDTIADLQYMMDILKDNIENKFCHVSEHLPGSLIKLVDKIKMDIEKELVRRKGMYY